MDTKSDKYLSLKIIKNQIQLCKDNVINIKNIVQYEDNDLKSTNDLNYILNHLYKIDTLLQRVINRY